MAHKTLLFLGLALAISPLAAAQDGSSGSQPVTLADAREDLDEVKANRDHVDKLLVEARQGEDEELQRCVASRASQLTTLAEVSESILSEMTSALGEGEDGRAAAEGRKLGIAATRSMGLRAEADGCVEGGETITGDVIVEDPYAGEEDEDINTNNDGVGVDPPGASPFE